MIEIVNSQDYENIKNTLKLSPSVKSQHKIIGEWNFNSIKNIEHLGVYRSNRSTFSEGQHYDDGKASLEYLTAIEESGGIVLDGEFVENTMYNSYYSLIDCFLPFRPPAGVVYPMANSSNRQFNVPSANIELAPIAYLNGIDQLDNLPGGDQPFSKTYLPHKDMQYKYWNSATYGVKNNLVIGMTGIKNFNGTPLRNNTFNDYGFITTNVGRGNPYPFAVYDSNFYCNFITVKYQTHLGVPNRFFVDVLQNGSWVQIFSSQDFLNSGDLPQQHSNGVLKIFRDTDKRWKPLSDNRQFPAQVVDFLTEGQIRYLPDGTTKLSDFDDEAIKINGIRIRVVSMTTANCPFELIELSPRLVVDLTDYTLSFSCSTSIGEGTESLPTSNLILGTGDISLSNTDGGFFNENEDSILYQSIGKGVKVVPFQTFELENGKTYQIPIKTLYVENWVESPNYVVSASLNDFMKILQSQKCSSVMISTLFRSVPVSFAVQSVLHSIGVTNFKFLDSETKASDDIKYFYADDTNTVAEVLDEIAKSTQASVYIDAFNNVVCATKDKVLDKSYKLDKKEPEWWLTTEDIKTISVGGHTAEEVTIDERLNPKDVLSQRSLPMNYMSNVSALTKNDTEPINDGEIVYTTKTFLTKRQFPEKKTERLAREDPTKLVGDRFQLQIKSLWSPTGNGSEEENADQGLLYGGVIFSTIERRRLESTDYKGVRTGFFSDTNKYPNFQEFLSVDVLTNKNIPSSIKLIKISPIDAMFFLKPFNGYLRVNQEIIRYNGLEFSVGSRKKWIFNQEQFEDLRSTARPRDVISATGRVGIWMEFDEENPEESSSGVISYKVKDSGRGQFDTRVSEHEINKFQSNDKDYINGWEMDTSYFCGSESLASTKDAKKINNHIIEKTKSRLIVGSTNSQSIKDYSGNILRSGLYVSGSEGRQLSSSDSKIKIIEKFIKDDIKNRDLKGEENYDNTLRLSTTGDLMAQGITKSFTKKYDSFFTSLTFLNKKGRTKKESVSSTMAAGMAVHYNKNTGEGYFIEIAATSIREESSDASSQIVVYKVKQSSGKNVISILGRKDIDGNLFEQEPFMGQLDSEQFKNIAIRIRKPNHFVVYANNKKVLSIEDKKEEALRATNDAFLFVRGDTVVLFDKFVASSEPINSSSLFLHDRKSTTFKLTDDYYNNPSVVKYPIDAIFVEEFGDNIYQVKKFKFKYTDKPAPIYEIADLTPIGAEYFIEDHDLHPFGGEIVISNASGSSFYLSESGRNGLLILGSPLSNYGQQRFTVSQFLEELPSQSALKDKILSSRRKNGRRSFSISAEYIQTDTMSRRVMEWIMENAAEPKITANIECFCNPLLELTDAIKIFSPRNNINQNSYFSITSLNYSIDANGPSLTAGVREIG